MVRRIFAMRAFGMVFRKIAVTLNAEGIQPPGELYYQRQGRTGLNGTTHDLLEGFPRVLRLRGAGSLAGFQHQNVDLLCHVKILLHLSGLYSSGVLGQIMADQGCVILADGRGRVVERRQGVRLDVLHQRGVLAQAGLLPINVLPESAGQTGYALTTAEGFLHLPTPDISNAPGSGRFSVPPEGAANPFL